jgi:uncharacterized protein with beta-barrel porin domain
MVALAGPNVVFNAQADPAVVRVLVVEIRKASTGDTVDVGSQMSRLGPAVFVGSTVNVHGPATSAGTVVTLPAGLTNDSGYLVVLGL